MSDFLWPHGLHSPWNSPGQNTGVGSLSLLQGVFPNQGSNPGLPRCGPILYQLSHKETEGWGFIQRPLRSGTAGTRSGGGGPWRTRAASPLWLGEVGHVTGCLPFLCPRRISSASPVESPVLILGPLDRCVHFSSHAPYRLPCVCGPGGRGGRGGEGRGVGGRCLLGLA